MKKLMFCAILMSLLLGCGRAVGQSFDDAGNNIIPLYEGGAPGFEHLRDEIETSGDWWRRNIHNPNLTLFKPKGEANGAAVIVVPGGGHHSIVWPSEGVRPAEFLAEQGITVFVLKYRLAREKGSVYSIEKHAAQDLQRAMRLVRARANTYGVDPSRIGLMGFSAGGELVSMVTYGDTDGDIDALDAIEKVSSKPNFQIQIYPGPLGIADNLTKIPPPAFLLSANDDLGAARNISRHLDLYRVADGSVEVHLFAKGGHAFNMGSRSKLKTINSWPDRLLDWMHDNELLGASSP